MKLQLTTQQPLNSKWIHPSDIKVWAIPLGINGLTLKAPPIICSRRQMQVLPPFQK